MGPSLLQRLAVGGSWRFVVGGGWWWLAAVGGWRLVAVGGWSLAVDGLRGLSITAVLNKKNRGLLKDSPGDQMRSDRESSKAVCLAAIASKTAATAQGTTVLHCTWGQQMLEVASPNHRHGCLASGRPCTSTVATVTGPATFQAGFVYKRG